MGVMTQEDRVKLMEKWGLHDKASVLKGIMSRRQEILRRIEESHKEKEENGSKA